MKDKLLYKDIQIIGISTYLATQYKKRIMVHYDLVHLISLIYKSQKYYSLEPLDTRRLPVGTAPKTPNYI
jgi:hypothetical protein